MDFSEQYIKMCQQATEIQKQWTLNDGDFFITPPHYDVPTSLCDKCNVIDNLGNTHIHEMNQHNFIWLPRWDELYEMIFDEYSDPNSLISALHKMYLYQIDYVLQFSTTEQLLLCFVMSEKFNKKWDTSKENWVDK